MTEKVRADQIKRALAQRHKDDCFWTEVLIGPAGSARFDALAIIRSYVDPCIYGYEVKVTRADFNHDDKWGAYLPSCNRFAFAVPTGLVQASELPPEVGLIYFDPAKQTLRTVRHGQYRPIPTPVPLLQSLVINRTPADRQHPFFSSQREYLEAWLQDKQLRWELSAKVRSKLLDQLEKAEDENRKLQIRAERGDVARRELDSIHAVLKESGIRVSGFGGADTAALRERLVRPAAALVPADLERQMAEMGQRLGAMSAALKKVFGGGNDNG